MLARRVPAAHAAELHATVSSDIGRLAADDCLVHASIVVDPTALFAGVTGPFACAQLLADFAFPAKADKGIPRLLELLLDPLPLAFSGFASTRQAPVHANDLSLASLPEQLRLHEFLAAAGKPA